MRYCGASERKVVKTRCSPVWLKPALVILVGEILQLGKIEAAVAQLHQHGEA